MITAILLAQWRSMRSFRTGTRGPAVAISWISGLLFYGFWAVAAFGAEAFFSNPENSQLFPLALSGALLLAILYWQVTPVVTASMGASIDLKKLLAYPVPHARLFVVELLLRLTTCAEMLLVLAGIVSGLARNPEIGGVIHLPRLLLAAVLFTAFNVLLSAAIRNILERLLLRKRVKEVMMFLLIAVTIVPQFLLARGAGWQEGLADRFPDAPFLPWSATSRLLLGTSLLVPLTIMAVAAAGAYFLARWQFETNLHFDGASSAIRPLPDASRTSRWERLFRWPSLVFSDPIAAIMEKEFRSLLRTPQFRFIFFTGAAFGLVMYIPHLMGGGIRAESFLSQNVLTFASVYGVLLLGQVSYFNCFGYDRSAAQAWFSYPVPFARTLAAKNLAALTFILVEIIVVALTAFAFRIHLTAGKLVENVAVTLIAALYLVAFGNIASLRFPRPLIPERISQQGSTKALNALILIAFPVLLLPVALAYWARHVFRSELVFCGLLILAAGFGVLLYVIGLQSALEAGRNRREKILTDLSRGEGPISA